MAMCKDCFHFGVCQGDLPYYNSDAEKCKSWACRKDIVVRPNGRWISVVDMGGGNCYGYCSNCMTPHKADNTTALRMTYRYCRWCGAEMRGD